MKRRQQRPTTEKKTSISLPPELWERVKITCIKRDISFRAFLIEALEHEMKRGGRA